MLSCGRMRLVLAGHLLGIGAGALLVVMLTPAATSLVRAICS